MITNEKDAALIAIAELETALRDTRLPVVCIIGLPSTGERVRFAGGMGSETNRAVFLMEVVKLLEDEKARHEAKEKKGGKSG